MCIWKRNEVIHLILVSCYLDFFQYVNIHLNVPGSDLIKYHLNYTLYEIDIKCGILFKILQNKI